MSAYCVRAHRHKLQVQKLGLGKLHLSAHRNCRLSADAVSAAHHFYAPLTALQRTRLQTHVVHRWTAVVLLTGQLHSNTHHIGNSCQSCQVLLAIPCAGFSVRTNVMPFRLWQIVARTCNKSGATVPPDLFAKVVPPNELCSGLSEALFLVTLTLILLARLA